MRKIPLNFILLHYVYIIFLGLLGLAVFLPYGNVSGIDSYFFGVSSSTESGMNPVDLKDLKTYQQLFLYFVPIVSNLGFINILVVVVRLYWFEKRLKEIAPYVLRPRSQARKGKGKQSDQEAQYGVIANGQGSADNESPGENKAPEKILETGFETEAPEKGSLELSRKPTVTFGDASKALYIPPPWERDRGCPIIEVDQAPSRDDTDDDAANDTIDEGSRRQLSNVSLNRTGTLTSVRAPSRPYDSRIRPAVSLSRDANLPGLSSQATLGRNSQFLNLTTEDRERLGGIEYRSLRLLLKIVIAYYVGLNLLGSMCLAAWIQHAKAKYQDYLDDCALNKVWWAFYSAQTMANNLGLTLTPDSMVTFQDATFPMFVMSFLAYAGNTLYPCFLRLVIWIMFKLVPKDSSMNEPLNFLLSYPRRCYVLLFRSRPTWALAGIIFVLNFVDTLLILLLDLDNPAVNHVPVGPRVMAAIFQAASARHTGTASFNLADVNPAVQFSLLVMMYIAVFPIAITVRASNIYEEKALGIYSSEPETDENRKGYILTHMRNQLSFDLWYIFLGIFCICVAESKRIMNPAEPGFSVFAIFFEAVSAYGNVGLSLGYPGASTSFSAQFSIFSKLVVCALMIRGRHRGLPSQLDRAVLLPSDRLIEDDRVTFHRSKSLWSEYRPLNLKVRRYHTR
ncbi:putative potassium uptake transporter [Aspergillus mulundensis]|uniref:Potassium ion transporter n=1 Tax=Aspergillus mulundensis TaxID=1810919 RepID=A0A3D8QFK8_9EURO|nr:Potassium ion transporter [Aspergillus mulundensis]RDW60458.1 Potassium ion transporter [Aspergillus mulundensis]